MMSESPIQSQELHAGNGIYGDVEDDLLLAQHKWELRLAILVTQPHQTRVDLCRDT